jgi:DNA-binding transcriptional MerR regulator
MNIGQAAQASGLSAKMIRYYEDTGLIPATGRTMAGHREYNEKEVPTLRFTQRARRLGVPVQSIRQFLALWQGRNPTSAEVKALAPGPRDRA